jgi:hypothetical protein
MKSLVLAFFVVSSLAGSFAGRRADADEIKTNAVHMSDAPKWVTPSRIDRIVDHIQNQMEWDVRRVEVRWYHDQTSFESIHHMGPSILAYARTSDSSVHLGPRVTDANFDAVFGHEMVHVVSNQKYKGAIPMWLEEGLANYFSRNGNVNYAWLNTQPFPSDVHELTHPYNVSEDHLRYHYQASQALAEMLAKKCDLNNLLRMSVGKSVDHYLASLCNITDLNGEFKKWVTAHK